MSRIFIIGDVHGCLDELNELIEKLNPQPGDIFLFLGDLCDRGKDTLGVIHRVQELLEDYPESKCICGNHEEKAIRLYERRLKDDRWAEKWITRSTEHPWMKVASEEDWQFLNSLPLLHRFETRLAPPMNKCILVHGGFFPRFFDLYDEIGKLPKNWRRKSGKLSNRLRRFLRVRRINEHGNMVTIREQQPGHQHWSKLYKGQAGFAFFGHDNPQIDPTKPVIEEYAIGVDTGCVFNGCLTAAVISDQLEFVSVKAHKKYFDRKADDD